VAHGLRHAGSVTADARGARWWLASSALFAAAAVALWSAPRDALDWQPARALAEPWRAWTAAFVHWTPRHLGGNLAGCVVVGVFGLAARVPARAAAAWFAAWPVAHAALALQPQLERYGGLSGVLHAGVAVAAWHLLRHEHGQRRAIGVAVIAGLAVKLALERPWAAPLQQVPGWDFAVVPLAHATGAVAGLLCAVVADALARRRA
jgi:rhomboid family GlyGly-CTERM serine protease